MNNLLKGILTNVSIQKVQGRLHQDECVSNQLGLCTVHEVTAERQVLNDTGHSTGQGFTVQPLSTAYRLLKKGQILFSFNTRVISGNQLHICIIFVCIVCTGAGHIIRISSKS